MRWTCPKCGKKLDISNEQLLASDGVIVCPQCLQQARQPLPRVTVQDRDTSSRSSTPPARTRKATPPPHVAQATSTSAVRTSSSTARTNTSRKKKKSKRNKNNHVSAFGCLLRSIAITLILFAAYVFVGLLLETIT